jgi:predicted nucleic acid-binding Zn ribbon protein
VEQLGQIINKRLNQHQIGESARASEVVFKANQYLSSWLKCEHDEVRAMSLNNGALHIGSGSAVWSQETRNISDPLLKKLQDEYGKTYITKIRIRSITK